MSDTEPKRRLVEALRTQAGYCRVIGSPMYEELLTRAAEDASGDGVVLDVLLGREDDRSG